MTSERTINLVVIGLIVVGGLASIAGAVLLYLSKDAGALFSIAATAVGSLASILAATSTHPPAGTTTQTVTTDPGATVTTTAEATHVQGG